MTEEHIGADIAHPARVYDYWLGGTDNFAADRAAAEQVMRFKPEILDTVRGNRRFLARAVAFLRDAGIRQFIDIGSGLPSRPNAHEVAQALCEPGRPRGVRGQRPAGVRAGRGADRAGPGDRGAGRPPRRGRGAGPGRGVARPDPAGAVRRAHPVMPTTRPGSWPLPALVPGSYLVVSHVTNERAPEKMARTPR